MESLLFRFGEGDLSQRLIITISYWVATFCEGASRIIIPLYFAALGVNASLIGIMFFTYEVFSFAMNVFSGFIVNRLGYRFSIMFSLAAHSVASLGYLLVSDEPSTVTFLVINALRGFRGIGKELIKTTSSAYLKNDKSQKNKYHGIQMLLGGKDGVKGLGLLLGGVLLAMTGFHNAFLVLGVSTLICMGLCVYKLDDIREKKTVKLNEFFLVRRKMRILAFTRAFLYAGRDVWLVVATPIYLQSQGISEITIGTILAVGFIVFGGAQVLGGFLIRTPFSLGNSPIKRKWRFRDSLIWTHSITAAIPLLFFAIGASIYLYAAIVIAYNFCAGIATAPHNHLHIKYARGKRSSIDIAYYKTISHIGKVISVLISGLIYQHYSIGGCIATASFMLVCGAGISFTLKKPKVSNLSSPVLENDDQPNQDISEEESDLQRGA